MHRLPSHLAILGNGYLNAWRVEHGQFISKDLLSLSVSSQGEQNSCPDGSSERISSVIPLIPA